MSERFAVILPAAGQSTRFGGPIKKPFVELDGKPIWQRSAELFWNRDDVVRVILVVDPEDRETFRERYGPLLAFHNITVVEGGSERFASVNNALAKLPDESTFVAIHDAVRPLTTRAQIDAVFANAVQHRASILAVPVADTLKRVADDPPMIQETVDRKQLWQAQTPQVFRRDDILKAYLQLDEQSKSITDDAQLIESLGIPIHVTLSSRRNFKITTRDDLDFASALLAHAKKNEPKAIRRPFDDDENSW